MILYFLPEELKLILAVPYNKLTVCLLHPKYDFVHSKIYSKGNNKADMNKNLGYLHINRGLIVIVIYYCQANTSS